MAESPSAAPGRIFISYRREETAYPAGWLFDRLAARFGNGQVFKDVDSIELGDDFVEAITSAVGSCDVLLALIGDEWLTITDEDGRRRLDNADDFVRLEIEAALTRKVRVIPVLVDGATMPDPDDVPPSLVPLTRRQALELSPSRFDFDTSRLLKVLDKTLAEVQGRPAARDAKPAVAPGSRSSLSAWRRRFSRRTQLFAASGIGLLVLVPLLLLAFWPDSKPQAGEPPPRAAEAIFEDDFSSRANGWDDVGPKRDGGHYANGAYRIFTTWKEDHFSDHGFPRDARSVFPSAPSDVHIGVVARPLLGADQDAGYGIACRANRTQSYYQFAIWREQAVIAKLTPVRPFYVELDSQPASLVDANGRNRLEAVCTTDDAQDVHLEFWVNGKRVAWATDPDRPLLTGTVGLLVATGGSDVKSIEAEFDDFIVKPA
jgi:hypothetical protein